ncbi:MAG: GT4 family glycosyltransferase PelF [Planctomycetota bacterium]|jgi:glycosyltransferase involved in cell wall biosynthesis|nr:GT4 family glycosyltransferase PelF [Planctomycetota bacterium]
MIADVCIVTEGTYPYVMGGVSTWIAQILDTMPQLKFSLIHVSASRLLSPEIRYALPPNLVSFQNVYLYDFAPPRKGKEVIDQEVLSPEEKSIMLDFYLGLTAGRAVETMDVARIARSFEFDSEFVEAMAHSQSIWSVLTNLYRRSAPPGLGFLDFFWTARALFMPILNLMRTPIPRARVYHASCTGYAGFLGARARRETGRPYILTEHGIYSRERRIELSRIDWLSTSGASRILQLERSRNWFREWWVRLFQSLSRTAYAQSSRIISLYQGNKDTQIHEGANAAIIDLIPNGIIVDRFKNIPRRRREPGETLRIGFVGRVASIKDIKTLLRAMSILAARKVDFITRVTGPMDEEPEYTDECLDLCDRLELTEKVLFPGPSRDLPKVYSEMDVLVLTSVSEGFPFVILEANCAGVPVVATNVGACRDILTGMNKEDLALGPSGLITPVNAPGETAKALERLARDPALTYAYGMAGRERAIRFYDLRLVMAQYQQLYETYVFAAGKAADDRGDDLPRRRLTKSRVIFLPRQTAGGAAMRITGRLVNFGNAALKNGRAREPGKD